jgi:hypothetical protein
LDGSFVRSFVRSLDGSSSGGTIGWFVGGVIGWKGLGATYVKLHDFFGGLAAVFPGTPLVVESDNYLF